MSYHRQMVFYRFKRLCLDLRRSRLRNAADTLNLARRQRLKQPHAAALGPVLKAALSVSRCSLSFQAPFQKVKEMTTWSDGLPTNNR